MQFVWHGSNARIADNEPDELDFRLSEGAFLEFDKQLLLSEALEYSAKVTEVFL